MYGIDGRRDLTERTLDDLSGYAGASPVRVGNGAYDQRQNDVFGAVLDFDPPPHSPQPAIAPTAVADRRVAGQVRHRRLAAARPGHLGGARRSPALRLLEADVLGGARPSRKAGGIRGDPKPAEAWRATSEEIKEDILANGLKDGVLRQHYSTEALDASTLLAALFGFLPGDDERLRKSVLAIADDLTEDGFVLRYRTGETDDGMSGKEGSFLICSFWLVSALAIVGESSGPGT